LFSAIRTFSHVLLQLGYAQYACGQLVDVQLERLIELKGLPKDRVPVVTAIAIQPNGNLLATAGDDHIVRLWDVGTGELVRQLRGHRDWVTAVSFCSDGSELITGCRDRRVLIWNVGDGKLRGSLGTHEHPISTIVVSPQDEIVAIAGFRAALKLYDLKSRKLLGLLTCPCKDTRAVDFSSDLRFIASAGRNGKIRIWNLTSGKTFDIDAHARRVRSIVFVPGNDKLVSAGDDPLIRVWDLANGNMLHQLPSESGKVLSMTMIGNNQLATSSSDNVIRLFRLNGSRSHALLTGHTGSIAALIARNQKLISGSFDTTVRIWSIQASSSPVTSPMVSTRVISTANAN